MNPMNQCAIKVVREAMRLRASKQCGYMCGFCTIYCSLSHMYNLDLQVLQKTAIF